MMLALEMGNPYLPMLLAKQGDFALSWVVFYSALALVLPMVANIIMSPLWGKVGDRLGYKPMLMRAAWALVISQGLMIFAHSISSIIIIRIFQGGFAGFLAAMQTYALCLTDGADKGQRLAELQSAKALATCLAGAVGGLMLMFFHFDYLYGVASVLCLLTTLLMQWLLPSIKTMPAPSQKQVSAKLSGSARKVVGSLGVLIGMTQLIKFLPDPVFTLLMNQRMPGQVFAVGVLYSLPSLGLLLTSAKCGKQFDKCRQKPELIPCYLAAYCLIGALSMLIQAFATQFITLACARLLWGVVLAALLPALICLMSDRFRHQGYALGLANSFAKIGNLVGLILGGLMGNVMTLGQLFLLLAVAYLLMMLVSFVTYRRSQTVDAALRAV
jgi:MFS family permease